MTEPHQSPFDVRPLSDALGAEIVGLSLCEVDDDVFTQLRAAWMAHQVLLFRHQDITDRDLVAFSERIGPLDIAPPNENGQRFVTAHPEILVISNVVENGVAIGSLGSGEAVWHSDMNYIDEPPTASVLWGLEIPPLEDGGNTGFLNMYLALEDLPDDLRSDIQGLHIKHDSSTNSAGLLREGAQLVTDVQTCPGAVHPMIRTHPETGRDALYLGRRRNSYIIEKSVAESEALLDALWQHVTQDRFCWYQEWQVGDVVMWDNRCVMHRRDAFNPDARRVMHRTQIKGGRPFHNRTAA